MTRLSLLIATIAALLLGRTELTQAQANCPSTNNLSFINVADGSVVTTSTLSNKAARIYIAAIPFLGGSYINAAFIWFNGGSCKPYWLSYDGVNVAPTLTKHTNLCLGYLSDEVDNIAFTHPQPLSCGGNNYTLHPMLYNGYRLDTYAGGGNDEIWGSDGGDRIWGGNGSDLIHAGSGADRVYGEASNDELYCSYGDSTHCSGSSGADYIEDSSGFYDSINGGSSDDDIWSCGQWTTIDCGESNGDHDILYSYSGSTHTGCETAEFNPLCDD